MFAAKKSIAELGDCGLVLIFRFFKGRVLKLVGECVKVLILTKRVQQLIN
jgi:hypothetical protein